MTSTFFARFVTPVLVKPVLIKPAFGLVTFSFTTVALTVLAATAHAQDDLPQVDPAVNPQSEKKVIQEPIHRVPKVASNIVAPANTLPNARNKTQSILPSATRTLPSEPALNRNSNLESPAAGPAPATSKIPAIPASSVKPVVPARAPHPLDDALATARRGLVKMRTNIKDYSAIMVKRERVDGELLKPEYMQVKVRSEHVGENGRLNPFGIYVKFIKPRACAGREVIWVKGRNNGKLSVHEASGIAGLRTFHLNPESWLAMKGQRYPISEAGMENLIVKLIEKAERDRNAGDCEVNYITGVKINGRECDVIEVIHPEQREPYDFHIAKVYIDKELEMPIRYQAHLWPESPNAKPKLLEQYTYLNVKVNQGFTDEDFSIANPTYSFP